MRSTLLIQIVLLIIIIFAIKVSQGEYENKNFHDLFHLNKRHSNEYYLDQCAKVYFIMGQLGIVNVLIFLDDSWPFSYKQATMLKELKDRLERSGVPETLFFAIIRDPTTTPSSSSSTADGDNSNDDDTEREAWAGVSPEEVTEISSNPNDLMKQPLIKIISPDIFVIEDSDELNIWRELKGSRNQIIVIDRCGKLTYQIIIPWSILHFPYVKAAILSTHNDHPCDRCDSYATVFDIGENSNVDVSSLSDNKQITSTPNDEMEYPSTELSIQSYEETTIVETSDEHLTTNNPDELENYNIQFPDIRIIMRAPHYHIDDDPTKKHEYLVLKLHDTNYHGHINGTHMDDSYVLKTNESLMNRIVFDKDESPGLYGEVSDYWRDINNDYNAEENQDGINEKTDDDLINGNEDVPTSRINGESSVIDNISDISMEENNEEVSRNKLLAHYSRLLPWLYYVLDK